MEWWRPRDVFVKRGFLLKHPLVGQRCGRGLLLGFKNIQKCGWHIQPRPHTDRFATVWMDLEGRN